jgi:non-ribosomal peptide synthetase-like protein
MPSMSVLRGPDRPDLLRDESLADILAANSRDAPHRPALISRDRTISYGELASAADAIGRALTRRGASPGRVIGLWTPRGPDGLVAQAGIARSGAAWLPLDPDWPIARVRACLELADAIGLVTSRDWLSRVIGLAQPAWALEDLRLDRAPPVRRPVQPSDLAYVMFTSGSTGEPKGIGISQRSICHLLRSENEMLGVRADDRVYQGFSLAFDMSFEEIWIAYLVGAAVWIPPAEMTGDPDAVAQALSREGITVVHAVPSLMDLIRSALPTVRLINFGGEACSASLVDRFTRPGRRLFNSYGPTETTVSATIAELRAGEPVSIGQPLPNYGVAVVDAALQPVPMGEAGELCVFGPGVAIGYLGRLDVTRDHFVPSPVASGPNGARMFRTGDRGRIVAGSVQWLGRIDDQIKIRGYRVELGEIRAALAEAPHVAAAAVVVRPIGDLDQIVGFVVSAPNAQIDLDALRASLADRLPRYMRPTHVEILPHLPRVASDKVDVQALKTMPLTSGAALADAGAPARTVHEQALFVALAELWPGGRLTPEADFFDDLGGHSLLVARLVSVLRQDARYADLSVQDVYRARRLSAIARTMASRAAVSAARPAPAARRDRPPVPAGRRFLCGVAQAAVTPLFVLVNMADWLAPFFVYHYFTGDEGDSVPIAVLYSLATFVLARIAVFAIAIGGKRVVAGRIRPGRYPLWGVTYFRWWLSARLIELPDVYLLAATSWMPLYLRALGARIGRNVMIDTITIGAPELLTIDAGVSLGTFVNIENARVEDGELIVGPVHLREESVVDSYAVLENDTTLGLGARLCPQSTLSAGRHIPDREVWDGAPSQRSTQANEPLPPRPRVSTLRKCTMAGVSAVTALLVSALFFLPTLPAFMAIDWLDVHSWNVFDSQVGPAAAFGLFLILSIPASVLFVALTIGATALLRAILPQQRAGMWPVHSAAFWRKRAGTLIIDASLDTLHGLYASIFASTWLRLLGARVGRRAEVSTAEGMVPELLTLGDDTFIGDGAVLGDEEVRGGWMVLKPTRVGKRSFIGNGAYVADGAVVPDDVLIGVQTRAPRNEELASGQTWMGSPPVLLPARERVESAPEALTFQPSRGRQIARGVVEALRIVLPLAVIIAAGYLIIRLVMPLAEDEEWTSLAVALAISGCLFGLASFLGVAALKWILIGRYRPRAAPMWTLFVWLSEGVTNVYESIAVPNFLDLLRGTPMLPWALRLLGARIGRGTYLNTTDITEFDCVSIGDHAELNAWCGPQTHLFEDRVMKIGTVDIGAGVTVGARTTVLYSSRVGDGVKLGPLTLVAKGEALPAGTHWEGTPALPVHEAVRS